MRNNLFALLGSALLAAACGGGGADPVSGPTSVGPMTVSFTVLRGVDRAPMSDAQVTVSGQTRMTDASGRVTFENVISGTSVTVKKFSMAYPERMVFAEQSQQEITIWNQPREYVFGIVYDNNPANRLRRLLEGTLVWVDPDAQIRASESAMSVVHQAIAVGNQFAPGKFHLASGPGTESGVVAQIIIDPDDKGFVDNPRAGGLTYNVYNSKGEIVSAKIVLKRPRVVAYLLNHEMGHVFGFRHSNNVEDLMNAHNTAEYPSQEELRAAQMFALRRAGTSWEDQDPAGTPTAATSSGKSEFTLACVR